MIFSERLRYTFRGTMAGIEGGAGWFSRARTEWLVVILTAAATACFTTAGQYVATVKIENDKIISANIVKTAEEFQSKFLSMMNATQKFISSSVRDRKISENEKSELLASILTLQLTMSPAAGRWPEGAVGRVTSFFNELAHLQAAIKGAPTFADLESVEATVKNLVAADLAIIDTMQRESRISTWLPW